MAPGTLSFLTDTDYSIITPSLALHFLWTQWRNIPLPSPGHFAGQTILVTGANTGLGFEAARHFVRLGAAHVVLACRSIEKAEAAAATIRASLPEVFSSDNPSDTTILHTWAVDLSSFASVAAFADRASTELMRLDSVVCNAGIARPDAVMAEGYESTITINVLATSLLAILLLPILRRTASKFNVRPRLAIVSSDAHRFACFAEAKQPSIFQAFRDPATMSHDRYNTSKLLEIYIARALARTLDAQSIPVTVTAVNPGFCRTGLFKRVPIPFRYIIQISLWLIGRSAEMGSRTLVAAAAADASVHGQFMDAGLVYPPSPTITSSNGAALQERVFREMLDELEANHPGLMAFLT